MGSGQRAPTPASCFHQVTDTGGMAAASALHSFLVWLITLINPKQPQQSTQFVTSSCSSAFNCIALSSHYHGSSAGKNRTSLILRIIITSAHRQKHEAAGLIPISVTALIFQPLHNRNFLSLSHFFFSKPLVHYELTCTVQTHTCPRCTLRHLSGSSGANSNDG
jgi:hypothetical protein